MAPRRTSPPPPAAAGPSPTPGPAATAPGPAAGSDRLEVVAAPRRPGRLRRFVVIPLVVLFAILLPVTTTLAWTHGLLFNTDRWVAAVGPIPSDPAVATAVGNQLSAQLFANLDVESRVKGQLPPQISFLSGPITTQAQGFVAEGITRTMQSPGFEKLWVGANRFAHEQVVQILEGNTKVVRDTNGQVVLNLVPLLDAGLAQASTLVSGVVGHPVQIPTISADEVPARACARLGSALGVALPSNCGQVALFPAAKLDRARQLVAAFRDVLIVGLIATPLTAAAALVAAWRRRRALLQLAAAGAIGLVVFRRVVTWVDHDLVHSGPPANQAARSAILGHVLHSFYLLTAWMLVGLFAVAVIAAVTGPYRWAVATRGAVASAGRALGPHRAGPPHGTGQPLGSPQPQPTPSPAGASWIGEHIEAVRAAAVLIAFILILALPVSAVEVIVILAVLAVVLVLSLRVSSTPSGRGAPAGPAPGTPAGSPPAP